MKKILSSIFAVLVCAGVFAQSNAKISPYSQPQKNIFTNGVDTYYYESGFRYQLGFTVPFFEKSLEEMISGKYGFKAEVGYMTAGQFSFYSGLAYQFYGFRTKIIYDTTEHVGFHELNIPAQLSIRFPSSIPASLRIGPYLSMLVGAYDEGDNMLENVKFGDKFEWGLQFNIAISYFQLGYSLHYNNGDLFLGDKGFNSSKLTIGLIF